MHVHRHFRVILCVMRPNKADVAALKEMGGNLLAPGRYSDDAWWKPGQAWVPRQISIEDGDLR
jgi:hypothetical protein